MSSYNCCPRSLTGAAPHPYVTGRDDRHQPAPLALCESVRRCGYQLLSRLPHRRPTAHGNDVAARASALSPADHAVRAEGAVLLQQPEDPRQPTLPLERAELVPALLSRAA